MTDKSRILSWIEQSLVEIKEERAEKWELSQHRLGHLEGKEEALLNFKHWLAFLDD